MPKVLEMGAKLQTILIGAYIHALTPTQLEMVQLGALAVNENGILRFKDCLQLYNSNAETKAPYAQDLDSLETLHSKKVAEYELTLRSRWQEYLTDDTRVCLIFRPFHIIDIFNLHLYLSVDSPGFARVYYSRLIGF